MLHNAKPGTRVTLMNGMDGTVVLVFKPYHNRIEEEHAYSDGVYILPDFFESPIHYTFEGVNTPNHTGFDVLQTYYTTDDSQRSDTMGDCDV